MSITVTSPAFERGRSIPTRHSQDGENLSPALAWDGVPNAAASLALVVDDPDAPRPRPFVHWVLYGLPADRRTLEEGIPPGATPTSLRPAGQGPNSYGRDRYDGPSPPRGHGMHHYHFTVYALADGPAFPPGLDKDGLLRAAEGRILDTGELVGTYERR